MKCPNCGAKMPVGFLYCEQCGEDIHIVPDFEPEVELNIEKTISEIAEDIKKEQAIAGEEIEETRKSTMKKFRKRNWLVLIVVAMVLVFLGIGVTTAIKDYQYHSLDYQMDRAEQCMKWDQYEEAIGYYKRALELSENDITIKFYLSEVYFLKNDKVEYENLLHEIVRDENASDNQVESAYGKLIAIYRAQDDFETINRLLIESNNEKIIATYQKYVAQPPQFSVQEGYYTNIQPLKLTSSGIGKIYYTLDGSTPNENSAVYTTPIILNEGEHTVRTYFVNEYGIASEIVTKSFHVEMEALPVPTVETVSGEYQFPIKIEVSGDIQGIYYTMDGTTPTVMSTPYVGAIPMPLGKTTFKFIKIKDGRSSVVVERTYNLVMNTEYMPEHAQKDVVAYLMESGKIYHEYGYAVGGSKIYKYLYQYVTNINQTDDFYVIAEFSEEADGSLVATGEHYAVNAYNGKIYILQIDEFNNYTLVEIEGQS